MRRVPWLRFLFLLLPGLLVAAPAPKDTPLPPITVKQQETSRNAMRIIALGMHTHHDNWNFFPGNICDAKGKPMLSWRVAMLTYAENDELSKEFRLDEPWDSDHNKKLIPKIPKIYQPVRGRFEKGETFYQMFAGPKAVLRADQPTTFATFTDGLSNTFLVVEAGKPVIWTKPDDIDYDGKTLPKLGGMFDGDFHAAMADGAVYLIKKDADAASLHAAIQPADGNVFDLKKMIRPKPPKE